MKKYIRYTEFFNTKTEETLYIFSGDERLMEKGLMHLKRLLFKEENTFDFEKFYAPSLSQIHEALLTPPLNAKRKLILIKEWEKMQERKECIKLFSHLLSSMHMVVVFVEKKSIEEFEEIKEATIVDFSPTFAELIRWVTKQAISSKKSIDYKVASYIVNAVDCSFTLLEKEMEKLILYLQEKDCITLKDVEEIICESQKVTLSNIFSNIESNKEKAAKLFLKWSHGKDPLYIIVSLVSHMKKIWEEKKEESIKNLLALGYHYELLCRKGEGIVSILPQLLFIRMCLQKFP